MAFSTGRFRIQTPFSFENASNTLFSAATAADGPAAATDGPAAGSAAASSAAYSFEFALEPSPPVPSPISSTLPSVPPPLDPAACHGFQWDQANGFDIEFESQVHFENWLSEQRRTRAVEFRRRNVEPCREPMHRRAWSTRTTYTCTRDGDYRIQQYERTKPERKVKAFKKEVSEGCRALITMKTYPNTTRLLVKYRDKHSHPLGAENVPYMTLSKQALGEIAGRLDKGESAKGLYKSLKQSAIAGASVDGLASLDRDQHVKRQDISRINARICAALYRLDPDDDKSVLAYVEKLRAEGNFVFIKTRRDALPGGTDLEADSFVLIIHMRYQQQCWYRYGHDQFVGIDATHNMTHYHNVGLYSLVVRDDWGHGVPAAYMLSSKADEATVRCFLLRVQAWSPEVVPRVWMSDKDKAQINAVLSVYATAWLLLCRWHVIRAWRQHFVIDVFPELWELVHKLAYAETKAEFDSLWTRILALGRMAYRLLAPEMGVGRTVFQESDTNMTNESMHHFYKDYIADRQRNKRMDLTEQLAGVHGHNLEQAGRVEVLQRAGDIPLACIAPPMGNSPFYVVLSQSSSNLTFYNVDVSVVPAKCTCSSYHWLLFCTHVAAVGIHFPHSGVDIRIYSPSARTRLHPHISVSGPPTSEVPSAPLELRPIEPISATAAAASHQLSKTLLSLAADVRANPRPLEELVPLQAAVTKFSRPVSELLPAKENLGNNHKDHWQETAKSMGASTKKKRKRNADSAEAGIAPRKTKQLRAKDIETYSERSGKRAKPDALRAPTPKPSPPPRLPSPPAHLIWSPSRSDTRALSPDAEEVPHVSPIPAFTAPSWDELPTDPTDNYNADPGPLPLEPGYGYLPAGPVYAEFGSPDQSGPIYLDRPFDAPAPTLAVGPPSHLYMYYDSIF
uniref:SWIM-type domain-containing protein n=1 Tax=Mycena chlorophos TaxID=658473 RepID=A0ABQ0LVX6_MYCCL|nr:predicted protein [Mycena chlorophos]